MLTALTFGRRASQWLASIGVLVVFLTTGHYANAEDFIGKIFTNAAGKTLPYRELEPKNFDSSKQYPLVLFLHGGGERGADNSAQLAQCLPRFVEPKIRNQFPCFVLAPQCPANQEWAGLSEGSPLQLVMDLLKSTTTNTSIDRKRIYVSGISLGGYGTWDCITRFPEQFAAAVPICGGGNPNTVTVDVAKVPVWAFHSSDDPTVNVQETRKMVQAMRKVGGRPNYFEYSRLGHISWNAAYSEHELFPWMFSQRLGKPDAFVLKTKAPQVPEVAVFPKDSDFPGQGPIRNAEWFRNLWGERRAVWWKNREKDKGAVVFLGDSIIQGWESLGKDFPNLKVANRGISGDFTRGVLFRLNKDVLVLSPSAVVLLIGTNDLEENGTPEVIANNIRLIITACREDSPRMPVVICKVMPSHASKKRPADQIQKLNALLEELVKDKPLVTCCDTWSIFADANGDAKLEDFPDLLHPNGAGYAKFAKALLPVLDKLNMPAKK